MHYFRHARTGDFVVTSPLVLGHEIAGVVDHVGVVARAPRQRIGARRAVEDVGAGIAGKRVVRRVPGGVDGGGTGELYLLDIGGKRGAHR